MGADVFIKIVPYVKCKNIAKTIDVPYHGCVNGSCSLFAKQVTGNFCNHCGGSIVKQVREEKQFNNPWDIGPRILNEKLYSNSDLKSNFHIYTSNSGYRDCPGIIDCGDVMSSAEPIRYYDVTNLNSEAAKAWFNDKFSNEIAALKQEYGPENVSVEYGLTVQISY